MSMFRDDYILRIVEKISGMIAAIVGLKAAGQLDDALQEVETATALLPGPTTELLPSVDSSTAATLLRQPAYIAAYARLVAEKACIQKQMGNENEAESGEERALELALEAYKREHEPPEALCALVDRLVSEGADKNLDESYLELLTRLRRH